MKVHNSFSLYLFYVLSLFLLIDGQTWYPRCRKMDDPMQFQRSALGSESITSDTWNILPSVKYNCTHHIFPSNEAVNGLLTKNDQTWLIFLSGSTGYNLAVNFMTFFHPRSGEFPHIPTETDEWAGCPGCELQTNNRDAPYWMDMVIDSNHNILWHKTSRDDPLFFFDSCSNPPCLNNPGLPADSLNHIVNWFSSHQQPQNSIRITWGDIRFFPAVYPFVSAVRQVSPGIVPTLFLQISVWYSMCAEVWCHRSNIVGRSDMDTLMESEALTMMNDFATYMPDLKEIIIANSQEAKYPDMNTVLDLVLANQPNPPNNIYQFFEFRSHIVIDPWKVCSWWNCLFPLEAHPNNLASQFYVQRILNNLIDSISADSNYGQNVTLIGDQGCWANYDSTLPPDNWITHCWHGCKYEAKTSGIYHGECSNFRCPNNFHSNPTKRCEWAICTEQECCLPNPPCSDFNCPIRSHNLSHPSETICTTFPCEQEDCCLDNPICGNFPCPSGSTLRTNNFEICINTTCTVNECCESNSKCDTYTCLEDTYPNMNATTVHCKGLTCSNAECCIGNPKCNTYTCYPGTLPIPNKQTITCNGSQCENSECCDGTPICQGFSPCSYLTHLSPNASNMTCVDIPCNSSECCLPNPTCDAYTCNSHTYLKPNPSEITCNTQTCTNTECCLPSASCSSYFCLNESTFLGSSVSSSLYCEFGSCRNDECCLNPTCAGFTCSSGMVSKTRSKYFRCKNSYCTLEECCITPLDWVLSPVMFNFTLNWTITNGSKINRTRFTRDQTDLLPSDFNKPYPGDIMIQPPGMKHWHVIILSITLIFDILMVLIQITHPYVKKITKKWPFLKAKMFPGDMECAWDCCLFPQRSKEKRQTAEVNPLKEKPELELQTISIKDSSNVEHTDNSYAMFATLSSIVKEENNDMMVDKTKEDVVIITKPSSPTSSPSSPTASLLKPESSSKSKPKLGRITALGFARFLASVHIVCGHLVRKEGPPIPDWVTSNWGYTWVPWFMMLSGYILTYSKLAGKDPDKLESTSDFVTKRVRSVYPLYLAGLFCSVLIASQAAGKILLAPSGSPPGNFVASFFLLQAWHPHWGENVFQEHCWFLSCIIIYWVCHNTVYRWLRKASVRVLWSIILLVCIAPWIGLVVVPWALGISLTWYTNRSETGIETSIDSLVVMLKYHPFFYWQIYLFGMVCAMLFYVYRIERQSTFPFVVRHGATIGYIGLFFIFGTSHYWTLPAHMLTCRLGMLAPFHALILIGLSLDSDYLTRIFGHKFLVHVEKISFPQYIFQFIAFNIWAVYTGLGYWSLLFCLAILGYLCVQEPFNLPNEEGKTYLQSHKKNKVLGMFSIFFFIPILCWILFTSQGGKYYNPRILLPLPPLPSYYYYSPHAYDVRLNFTSTTLLSDTIPTSAISYINPSLLYDEKTKNLMIAVRRHYYQQSNIPSGPTYVDIHDSGIYEKIDINGGRLFTWYSDIAYGLLNTSNLKLLDPLSSLTLYQNSDQLWTPCQQKAIYNDHNNTITQIYSRGPQDPRLYTFQNQTYVSFVSWPPAESLFSDCTEKARMYTIPLPTTTTTTLPTIIVPSLPNNQSNEIYPTELSWSSRLIFDPVLNKTVPEEIEKNWLAFNTENKNLFWVQSLSPYVILRENLRNRGTMNVAFHDNIPIFQLTQRYQIMFHGGANAILIPSQPNRTEIYLNRPSYYLGAFHTVATGGSKGEKGYPWDYLNYLYEFDPQPPYEILRISQPLPLQRAPPSSSSSSLAFLSGLTLVEDRLLISYGSSNSESRILSLSREGLELLFDEEIPF